MPSNFEFENMAIELAVFYSKDYDFACDNYTEYDFYLMKLKKASDNAVEKYIIKYLKDHPNK